MRYMFRIIAVLALVFAGFQGLAEDAGQGDNSGRSGSGSYQKTITNTLSAWEQTAKRAEEAIDAGRASTAALEELRGQLVEWRDKFLAAQTTNKSAIDTLQAQITALGPKPESGEETPEIANQRKDLEQRLAQLQAPVKSAEVAYSQADGLIRGIDQIIRTRQADALLELGVSPLNPVYWSKGVAALQSSLKAIRKELIDAWSSPAQQVQFKAKLPQIVFLLAVALLLLGRGRYWMERLTFSVQAKERTPARWSMAFILSIAQVILPLIGLLALVEALYATQMIGVRSDVALSSFVVLGVFFLLARWLGGRIFPKSEHISPPLNLTVAQRRKGRFYSAILGLLVGLHNMVQSFASFDNWSTEAKTVVVFPLLALSGYALLRIANLLRTHVKNEKVEGEERSYKNRIIYYLSRIILALAVIGPVLAAIGYSKAGQSIVFPTVMSLGLLALLLILQRMILEVYGLIIGSEERAREALIPVLLGFIVVLASTPLFALIWGARVTDLTELWTRFQEGFSFGGTRISPSDFLTFAIIFVIGYMVTRLIQGTLRTTVLPKTKLDVGGRNAIVSGVGYIGIFLSAVVAITAAGIDLSSLAIVAGALSVGIGFGLQNIVSNFVSGIILLIERPISEGDWIEVGGQMGYVRDISVRSTRIETFDRTDVIVPNSDLVSGVVTNWTRGNSVGRLIVPVGVAYGTDTKMVEGLLREIAEAHPMVLANPKPSIIFQGFGADSLDFEIRAILRDINWKLSVKSDINHEIARRFTEEGIEIPFAQRDVWLRNPEALQPKTEDE